MHRHFKRASCRACVDACAVGALTITAQGVSLSNERCLRCGNCLFVCPSKAFEHLPPPLRHFRKQRLVAPFTPLPPTADELLLWHGRHHIRGVEIDLDENPLWGLAVAALNLKLRERDEPCWQISPPQNEELNTARRTLLGVQGARVSTATMDPDGLSALFPQYSTHTPGIDPERCIMCAACIRVCTRRALGLEGQSLNVVTGVCNGCHACTAVCPVGAITVKPEVRQAVKRVYLLHEAKCRTCSRSFLSWTEGSAQCPLCQQHGYGMR